MIEKWKEKSKLLLASAMIGIGVGVITAIFGRVLIELSAFREKHFWILIPFLTVAGLISVWLYERFGQSAKGGMSLVFQVGHGEKASIPKRLIPLITMGTWLAHLFGASVGREGVAVQMGATVANQFRRWIHKQDSQRMLITIGMASGFAGLFGTPLAATFFALEVLVVGRLRLQSLFYTLVASVLAASTAQALGLEKFTVTIPGVTWDWTEVWRFIILGVAFGLAGRFFSVALAWSKKKAAAFIPNPYYKMVAMGIMASGLIALLFAGRYAGLGTNLIQASVSGKEILSFDWLAKLLLTVFCLTAGFQGGEVTPLFAIGSSLGVVLAPFVGVDVTLAAAAGYASVFGSATNTVIGPMLIGGEVFGFHAMPVFAVCCIVSFLINGNHTIYSEQRVEF